MEQDKALIEKIRFYLSDEKKVAEALLLIRNTEKLLEEAKEKVKEKAQEIMDKQETDLINYQITDEDTGEIRQWEIRRILPTTIIEYNPKSVFEVLGEKSFKYLKVSKSTLDTFMKKATLKKQLSFEDVEKITKDSIEKPRKGSITLKEIKPSLN